MPRISFSGQDFRGNIGGADDNNAQTQGLNLVLGSISMPADGWITQVAARVYNDPVDGSSTTGRLVLYKSRDRKFQSALQTWGNASTMRTASISSPQRFSKNEDLRWGFWFVAPKWVYFWYDQRTNYIVLHYKNQSLPPTLLPASANYTAQDGTLNGFVDYIAQVKPNAGSWQSPTPTGLITTSQPTFKGSMPHPSSEEGLDSTQTVQLKVYNRDNPSTIYYNQQFSPTSSEKNAGSFERSPVSLPAGAKVSAEFRHQDTWGAWSDWSSTRNFEISSGPDPANVTQPSGRINYLNQSQFQAQGGVGNLYRGTYNNPNGQPLHSVWVEVWNRERTTRLKNSGWVTRSATSGVWTLAEWSGHGFFDFGTEYSVRAKVREQDTGGNAGIEAPWGEWTDFHTNSLPRKPSNLSPEGGLAVGALDFSATVTDPDGDAIARVLMRITDVETSALVKLVSNRALRTAYNIGDEVGAGATTITQRFRALNSGRSSDIAANTLFAGITTEGVSVKDIPSTTVPRSTAIALNVCRLRPQGTTADALFFQCTTAGTTAATAPDAAYNAAVDGTTVTDGTAVFTARTAITWQSWGLETTLDMAVTGNSASRTLASSLLTLGKEYFWQALASDGFGFGGWSDRGVFVYALVPGLTMLAPRAAKRVNDVLDPSLEDTSVEWWEPVAHDATNLSEVTQDTAAAGRNFLRFSVDGTVTGVARQSPLMPVNASTARLFQFEARTISGTPDIRFRVACYNSGGTLLSTLTPTSVATTASATVPPSYWKTYGGIVYPVGTTGGSRTPVFPSGTTQVRIQFYPLSATGSAAVVDVDAFSSEEVTLLDTNAQWLEAQKWYRYFDGAFSESRVSDDTAYTWQGDAHLSASEGINILSAVNPKIYYRYTSAGGLNQNAVRLEIEEFVDGKYQKVYDSGMVLKNVAPNALVALDFPIGVVTNQSRYRLAITVRDTNLVNAKGPYATFDVFYYGPSERYFILAEGVSEKALVRLEWEGTDIDALDFDGYDLAWKVRGKPLVIFHRETSADVTSGAYPFPVHDEETEYFIRQRKRVSGESLTSRWTSISLPVSHPPDVFFLKDPEDPENLYLEVFVRQGENPTIASAPTSFGSYRPFEESQKTHFGSEAIEESEAYTINLYDDDQELERKFAVAEDFRKRPRTLILLAQRPNEKMAVYPRKFDRMRGSIPLYASYSIELEASSYSEDLRNRSGG